MKIIILYNFNFNFFIDLLDRKILPPAKCVQNVNKQTNKVPAQLPGGPGTIGRRPYIHIY